MLLSDCDLHIIQVFKGCGVRCGLILFLTNENSASRTHQVGGEEKQLLGVLFIFIYLQLCTHSHVRNMCTYVHTQIRTHNEQNDRHTNRSMIDNKVFCLFKRVIGGFGEMVQQLRIFDAFAEDLSFIFSTYIWQITTASNSKLQKI